MDDNLNNVPIELLCVFVHGFKGDNKTFGTFPERIQHILVSHGRATVECIVFPAYETKGELSAATERFVEWLTTTVVHREVANGAGGGAGKTKVVLCGHSMGGLLIADALLAIAHSRNEKSAPLWPRIIACIAYDTPYFGLHPFVFKNSASKAIGYVQAAHQIAAGFGALGSLGAGFGIGGRKANADQASTSTLSTSTSRTADYDNQLPGSTPVANGSGSKTGTASSPPPADKATSEVASDTKSSQAQSKESSSKSGWGKWAPALIGLGGAVVAGAAAGTAYYKREDLSSSIGWAGDHLKYVGNLWDEKKLRYRVDSLIAVRKESGVLFHNFYTSLPTTPRHPNPRTFIIVPRSTSEAFHYHSPNVNSIAEDEIQAHTGMFEVPINDGFYDLGLRTVDIILKAMEEVGEVEEREERANRKKFDLRADLDGSEHKSEHPMRNIDTLVDVDEPALRADEEKA